METGYKWSTTRFSFSALLFVVYINDLMTNVLNVLKLFADDTKIMLKIVDDSSCNALQDDLNKVANWSNEWSI
jgi:hypothetical protein